MNLNRGKKNTICILDDHKIIDGYNMEIAAIYIKFYVINLGRLTNCSINNKKTNSLDNYLDNGTPNSKGPSVTLTLGNLYCRKILIPFAH